MISTIQANYWTCQRDTYSDRAEWLNARRAVIGASDSPAIFNVGYADQSPVTVWDSKVNDLREDVGLELKRLKIGKLIEPALRAIFHEETGLEVDNPGDFVIFRNAEMPWLGATLDGVTEHEEFGLCPVELKNVSSFMREDWKGDEPPLKFQVQTQHQMAVTGASHAYLLGLVGGNEPVVKLIERNDRFIDVMLKRLADFWGYVERRELPPVDESFATGRLLSQLYPESNGLTVHLPDEADEWDREFTQAKADKKDAEAREAKYGNLLKAAIGENTFGRLPSGATYSWKEQSRAEHLVKASTFRVLRRGK